MRCVRKKISPLKDFFVSVLVTKLKIGFYLELWRENPPQSIGKLPLVILDGRSFRSCGSCIRIDSPEGQIITLIGDEFTLDEIRYRVRRRIQITRKVHSVFFSTFKSVSHRRTTLGLGCVALLAMIFFVVVKNQSLSTEVVPPVFDGSEKNTHLSRPETLEAQAGPTVLATQFSELAASSRKSNDINLTAVDVSPKKNPRAKSVKKATEVKDSTKKLKVDPVHCSPIKHISQSKILERLQSTAQNRRDWYVCR
ncbi:MAG: hypothetical protein RL189_395 [Pseudomonadota bacterium]|jgi:hypothetical protein